MFLQICVHFASLASFKNQIKTKFASVTPIQRTKKQTHAMGRLIFALIFMVFFNFSVFLQTYVQNYIFAHKICSVCNFWSAEVYCLQRYFLKTAILSPNIWTWNLKSSCHPILTLLLSCLSLPNLSLCFPASLSLCFPPFVVQQMQKATERNIERMGAVYLSWWGGSTVQCHSWINLFTC